MWYHCFVFFLFLLVVPVHNQKENAACTNSDGSTGFCTLMLNCAVGLKMLRTRGSHNLYRCGFLGFDEIVCCPEYSNYVDGTGSGTTTRSSTRTTTSTTTRRTTISTSTTPEPTKKKDKAQTRGQLNVRKSVVACEGFMKVTETRLTWHIIHGVDAVDGEFPHMAALGYVNDDGEVSWDCGGSLIAPRFILTAGHCIYTPQEIMPTKVRMGTNDLTNNTDPNHRDFDVEEHYVHPDFKRRERLHDIAILRLKQIVEFTTFIQPACLYTDTKLPKVLTITGWGINSLNERTWKGLQKATITESSLGECKEIYRTRVNKIISENQICASDKSTVNTTDACQGDSGGPLQVENLNSSSLFSIVGITSYGMGCGTNFPSIYTRVSAYLDFIEDYVWPD